MQNYEATHWLQTKANKRFNNDGQKQETTQKSLRIFASDKLKEKQNDGKSK